MAESAVKFLLTKLASLLNEEVQLLAKVREEVEFIKNKLELITVFIRADDAEEDRDQELKVWVKQVRELAYEAEDVVDEFLLHLPNQPGDGCYYSLCKISRSVQKLKTRRRIAFEVKGIKSKISSISDEHQTFRNRNSSTTAGEMGHDLRQNALLLEEAEIVGIDRPRQQLIVWLVEGDSELQVISVFGMGGLGKTTLVKKAYDDVRAQKHFRACAWVTVSKSFEIDELLKDMIQQLYRETKKPVPRGVETMNNHNLKKVIKEFLSQSTYMLVLDDVWNISTWDAFKSVLPVCSSGRVVLTTRDAGIASTSSKEFKGREYELGFLSPEDSLTLFCKKTFRGSLWPPHLGEICKCILKKCAGLPPAIVAISSVLAEKDQHRTDEWDMVRRSFGAEIESNGHFNYLRNVFSLSFNDLPYYLKSCFLYLSMFPEDHPIEYMRLIRLWIAEGFVMEREGRTIDEVAHEYFNELLKRSLIQVAETTSDGRVKTCRIHEFLREIIILKSRDQNFAAIAREQDVTWSHKVRRISIHNTLQNIRLKETLSQLRSLFMFGVVDPQSESIISTLDSSCFRMLNVIDLHAATIVKFPGKVVNSIHLRYLSLRGTEVERIPRSIKNLRNLETLDLKHTKVTELPVEILELQQLRHLLVYRYDIQTDARFNTKYGFQAPAKIGALQSLQKLCFLEANESDNARRVLMAELGSLRKLRRLGITKLRNGDGEAFCTSIQRLVNLRALSVTSLNANEILDLNHMGNPPQFLQRLYLTGPLEKLPQWIPSLHSLVKLYLKRSQLRDDPLLYLQDLSNLVHLELLQAYNGDALRFRAGKFKRLKLLGLDEFDQLRRVTVENEAMPHLEKLTIRCCRLLRSVPSGIEFLTELKVLDFFNMPDEFIRRLRPNEQGEDHLRVAHIPQIRSMQWRDGCWQVETLSESINQGTARTNQELNTSWFGYLTEIFFGFSLVCLVFLFAISH